MTLRAVIFDFDGVIADSERLHWEAFAHVLSGRGHSLTWEEYVARLMPYDDRRVFEHFFASRGGPPPASIDPLVAEKAAVYERFLEEGRLHPFPDALALIRDCHSHGMPLAVCTSSSRAEANDALDSFGVRDLFHAVVSADDVTACKPDPQGYRLTLARLREQVPGLEARETLAIEDSLGGARAAKGAGLRLLGLARVKSREDLRLAGADEVSDDLRLITLGTLHVMVADTLEQLP